MFPILKCYHSHYWERVAFADFWYTWDFSGLQTMCVCAHRGLFLLSFQQTYEKDHISCWLLSELQSGKSAQSVSIWNSLPVICTVIVNLELSFECFHYTALFSITNSILEERRWPHTDRKIVLYDFGHHFAIWDKFGESGQIDSLGSAVAPSSNWFQWGWHFFTHYKICDPFLVNLFL